MAKIQTESIAIIFSKLVKDTDPTPASVMSNELCESLEAVAQELVGGSVIVEVIKE